MSVLATKLALHYLKRTRNPTAPLKYIVFLGFLGMSFPSLSRISWLIADITWKRHGFGTRIKSSSSPLSTDYSASQGQHSRFSPSTGSASRQCNPHLPQVNNTPTPPQFAAARGETRTDKLMIGHGDTDLTFKKTANALFFCATNPDPNANGSIWALLQNGTIQRMEEAQEMGSLGGPPEYTELQNQGT